tara:strand:- start:13 stop:1323 length:1311 start_codon:yes stop_codon:yes gene_type:complete
MLHQLIDYISVFMHRILYSLVCYLLLPIILLRLLWLSLAVPAYRYRIAERFGFTNCQPMDKTIWVHAVSVGETLAVAPVVDELLQRYPDFRIIMTTTTPTGSEQVKNLFGAKVDHVYAPYDLPGSVQRFIRDVTPKLLIIMETELWPNLLHHCRKRDCSVLLVNARMSAKSANGYLRFPRLAMAMMSDIKQAAVQSDTDAERFNRMGITESAMVVTGSIKFDVNVSADQRKKVEELKYQWASEQRPIFVAASTHDGEDELILEAFSQIKVAAANALLVLVPRHPERFSQVLSLCRLGCWRVLTRSSGVELDQSVDILLGDTMGELPLFLGAATVAFVGGSLVPHGGHNMLEASAWGVPVLTGPHVFNFAEISRLLEESGGLKLVNGSNELAETVINLIDDTIKCQKMGLAGLHIVEQNRGATQRLLALIHNQLTDC